jgi:hypothetical protein
MPTFTVPQSGGTITISSTAAGFTQNSNPYQYYLNSGGANASPLSEKFTFAFADGGSFYLTDISQGNIASSENLFGFGGSNLVGIPSTPDVGYGSTINVIGGTFSTATYDIYDATSNVRLVDNFRPQVSLDGNYFNPIANFEYSSGTLTVRTPVNSSAINDSKVSINSAGTPTYATAVTGYKGGALSETPLSFALTGYIPPSPSTPVCFLIGTLIRMADGSEVPIEVLKIGGRIAKSKGPLPIKWIAKRTVWKQRASRSEYKKALPVRIQAGSLGDGIPCIDLLVSRCHGIWVDGKVVNASYLENDVNIAQASEAEFSGSIQYYHLEFDEEVLVQANGALAYSYVNMKNRRYFDNYPEFISCYCSADLTADTVIRSGPRNRPSLEGHKDRVKRAWTPPGSNSGSHACNQVTTAKWVTL